MIVRSIAHLLQICGTLMIFIGASVLPAQGVEARQSSAAPLLQPSPRPTLKPESKREHNSNTGPVTGRITGTIIDLTTGAPTPGEEVNIGGITVLSDHNGNYDLWVDAGPHSVALVLDPSRGMPAQGQQMVDVAAGATVILHLGFSSIAPPTATPVAASVSPAADNAPPPAPTAEPTTAPVAKTGGDAAPHPSTTARTRLPRTGEESSNGWAWIALGMLLLFGGVALELNRKRLTLLLAGAPRSIPGYENARLLAGLLARGVGPHPAEPSRAAKDALLLSALLNSDIRVNEPFEKPE
jgi:LPXTG-motif cell wall-anchored protein